MRECDFHIFRKDKGPQKTDMVALTNGIRRYEAKTRMVLTYVLRALDQPNRDVIEISGVVGGAEQSYEVTLVLGGLQLRTTVGRVA